MIKINKYTFYTYQEINDNSIINELDSNSKSKFIHNLKERLIQSKSSKEISFNNAYLVKCNNSIIGYVFLSQQKNNNIYIEYLILKEYRHMGHATNMMRELVDYIFKNYDNLENIRLSIDPSNIFSLNVASNLGFYCDEDSYFNDKLEFVLDNYYYNNLKR